MSSTISHTGGLKGSKSESQAGRLPTEILCNIFMHQRNISTVRQGREGRPIYDCGGFRLVMYGRRWRQIALEYPELWAVLPPVHPEWFRLMVQRSENMMISVDLGSWNVDLRRYQPLLADVLPQTSRLREVALRDVGWLVMETLAFMGPHAPNRRALSFIPLGCPSLRVLRLHNCSIQSASQLLEGLTEFHLSFVNNNQFATLPHLQRITVQGCQTFLRSLRIPTSCTIEFIIVEADASVIRELGIHHTLINERFNRVTLHAWKGDEGRQELPSLIVIISRFYRRTYNQASLVRLLASTFGIDQGQSLDLDLLIRCRRGHAQASPTNDLINEEQPVLAFPNLKVLAFHRVTFRPSEALEVWADLLQRHAIAGAALEKVTFENSMERLRGLVTVSGTVDYCPLHV
ncbi:hypothetical protein BKA70DRAFT_1295844 [Coprinopsis sp. MPI-PUGE-AT-0042]|nr:hypothetical protein BKA70DRAFT_1295844 [Coprinopsis sp. MPI-PUGE-AT-0042]